MKSHQAFTLSELLVAIVIIGILAAILLPIFARVRDRAQGGNCLSNMRLIGAALREYSQDNDQAFIKSYYGFPENCNLNIQPPFWYTWRYALRPYLSKKEAFVCPGSIFTQSGWWTPNVFSGTRKVIDPQYLPASYAVNSHVIGFANGECLDPVNLPIGMDRLADLQSPAGTIEFVDSRTGWPDMKALFVGLNESNAGELHHYQNGETSLPYIGDKNVGPFASHGGFVNIAFCDGHAKPMKLAQTVMPTDLWHSSTGEATRLAWLSTMTAEYK
jgi:prepilin-type N-terminal cleavage/methylation domain-containing protein/prepilin-type processing-associated H-X9-DG protein